VAAFERVIDQRLAEACLLASQTPESLNESEPLNEIVDLLRRLCKSPAFIAWLELVVAKRTDAGMRETLSQIGRAL
jgi:hypothetical protein